MVEVVEIELAWPLLGWTYLLSAFLAVPVFVLFRRAGLPIWQVGLLALPWIGPLAAIAALTHQRWPVLPRPRGPQTAPKRERIGT